MKLSRLLSIHSEHQDELSLVGNFGDGVLCQTNQIYRSIREKAIKAEYQFSAKQNNFYEALPLSQLEEVLKLKKIPYTDNVSVLLDIEKRFPQVSEWEDIQMHLKRNYLFHESCHAVARSLKPREAIPADSGRVFQMLLEESFANTCELLAAGDAKETAQKIFYEINSYSSLFEDCAKLNIIRKELGFEFLVKFLILVYLFSNYLFGSLTENQLQRIIILAQGQKPNSLKPKDLKSLRWASQICFTLDESFKLVTTKFYLRLNGIKAETTRHLTFDFLSYFEKEAHLQDYLSKLAEMDRQN